MDLVPHLSVPASESDPAYQPQVGEWVGFALGATTRGAAVQRTNRAKREGFTVWEADRIAAAVNQHPALIWGEAWWMARGEADEIDTAFHKVRVALRRECAA